MDYRIIYISAISPKVMIISRVLIPVDYFSETRDCTRRQFRSPNRYGVQNNLSIRHLSQGYDYFAYYPFESIFSSKRLFAHNNNSKLSLGWVERATRTPAAFPSRLKTSVVGFVGACFPFLPCSIATCTFERTPRRCFIVERPRGRARISAKIGEHALGDTVRKSSSGVQRPRNVLGNYLRAVFICVFLFVWNIKIRIFRS